MEAPVDILLVDDNANNLHALQAILGGPGTNLVTATSGAEALRKILAQSFALILLDIQMPDIDGFETAKLIRERDRSRRIPIIFLTAYNRSELQVLKGYQLGAVDFLFKPIVPEVLKSKVGAFVDLYRTTEEVRRQAVLLRDAERREHERTLAEKVREEKQRWEAETLRAEAERERANAMSLALNVAERERAQAELELANTRLRFLSESANRLLMADQAAETLVRSLLDGLQQQLGLDSYTWYRAVGEGDDAERHLELVSSAGLPGEATARYAQIGLDQGASGMAAQTGKPVIIDSEDRTRDPDWLPLLRSIGVTSCAAFPLVAHGRVIGTLAFGSKAARSFDAENIALMQVVSDQVAMVLDRARLMSELEARAADLAAADRRKDEFLAMLAHELRNPLAPIVTGLKLFELAEQTVRSSTNSHPLDNVLVPKVTRARLAMERQIRHMVRLVDDLLDVSRLTAGKIELRKEATDLASILEQAVQFSAPLIERGGHKLDISQPDHRVELMADPARLAQVVSNLLNNAAKYTLTPGHIQLRATVEGDDIVITVADNGRGIPADMLPRVFELFVQTDATRDTAMGGLGVGLTLVRRLVELHGGTVEVHSAGESQGAEFTVRIPRGLELGQSVHAPAPAVAPAAPVAPDSNGGAAKHYRVLVIDDNEDIRETLRDLLELLGHQVSVAEDGLEGLDKVRSGDPEITLIDIGLPGMDGYGVARTLRAEENGGKRKKLIALTGYGQADDRRRALEAGFDAHLVKPVDPNSLDELLKP